MNRKSVVEARNMFEAMDVVLQGAFDQTMVKYRTELSNKKLSELGIEFPEGYEDEKKLFAEMADEKVNVVKSLVSGMPQAIDSFIREEMTTRTPDSIKTSFLD